MHILTHTILLVLNVHYASLLQKKCCDADSHLKKNNSFYGCEKDDVKRFQIFTDETNFLQKAVEGTCYDTYPNITEYKVKNYTIVDGKPVVVNFYPKCCPLGYFYHSVAHSCVLEDSLNEGFITQNFVKVGLPDCKVIVDYELIVGQYEMELGKLYVDEYTQFQEGHFCVDRNENGSLIARGCYDDLSVCHDTLQCIHKCCPDGQSFFGGPSCVNTYIHGFNLSFTDRVKNPESRFAIIHKYECEKLHFLEDKIQYFVDAAGVFHAFYNKTNSFRRFALEDKSYCIEHVKKGNRNKFQFFMCNESSPVQAKVLVTRWAKILSCVFILITIAVYFFLPEMLNLFGKILMSYCVTMLVLFTSLTYAQFERNIRDAACVSLSFFFSYMTLVSFSWLNIMCFDIYCTFGTPKSVVTAQQRQNEIKMFLLYNLYGWGLPAVMTLLTFLVYAPFEIPYVVRPILGFYKCSWELRNGNYGKLLFYGLPLIFMEIANIVFFYRTIVYCLKVKREINQMNDTRISVKEKKKCYNLDKEQLFLIFKLSITMGISFAFDVVSSLFDFSINPVTEIVEVIWDTINCLQGVFIFLIFIFKMKVYRLCLNRIRTAKDRKISVTSLPTYTTQLSEPLTSKLKN